MVTAEEIRSKIEAGEAVLHTGEDIDELPCFPFMDMSITAPVRLLHCPVLGCPKGVSPQNSLEGEIVTMISGVSPGKMEQVSGAEISDALGRGEAVLLWFVEVNGPILVSDQTVPRLFTNYVHLHKQNHDTPQVLSLINVDFEQHVHLLGIRADATIQFVQCSFRDGLTVNRTVVDNTVRRSGIRGSLLVTLCEFGQPCTIESSDFERDVIYATCKFSSDIYLRGCNVGRLKIENSRFPDHVSIKGGSTSGQIILTGSEFNKGLSIKDVDVGKQINLDNATITGEANLSCRYWKEPDWHVRARNGLVDEPYTYNIMTRTLDVSRCTSTKFKTWVLDRNYQDEMRNTNYNFYRFWLLTTDCGRSFFPLVGWIGTAIFFFALVLLAVPDCFSFRNGNVIRQPFAALGASAAIFFSAGLGWIQPSCDSLRVLIVAEAMVAYIFLSLFIGILLSKVIRQR